MVYAVHPNLAYYEWKARPLTFWTLPLPQGQLPLILPLFQVPFFWPPNSSPDNTKGGNVNKTQVKEVVKFETWAENRSKVEKNKEPNVGGENDK